MAFKLVIESILDKTGNEAVECEYEQEVVRIGRQDSNEVQLQDPRRIVSGRHAEIRQKEDLFLLIDVGSKNGTRLNGEPLISGKEYPLKQEDQIAIGNFVLQFFPIFREETKLEGVEVSDATIHFSGTAEETETLLEELSRAYAAHPENRPEDREERRSRIAEILRKAVFSLDETRAMRLLDLVETRFPEPEYQQERLKQKPTDTLTPAQSQEIAAARAAYEALKKLVARYSANGEALSSPEEVAAFVDRLDRVLTVMVDSLADAVKGRKEFEEGFEVESTRIFMRKPNPIKVVEGSREIGAYLFDTNISESTDKVIDDLEDVFTDLALHQVGMMAGFKECLRGLLKQLDPDSFEGKERRDGGALRIGPLAKLAAWDRFREKHRELSEEEVRTFEQILGPYFAEGYLSIQKKKKSS
jgi:type VI secretion system protein ImpI